MELLIHVTATFIIPDRSGHSYIIRLFDHDLLHDDILAEQHLKQGGIVHFTVDPSQWRTTDSIRENMPDFYMIVLRNGEEIFRTPTAKNINLQQEGNFDSQSGLSLDLGEFLVHPI